MAGSSRILDTAAVLVADRQAEPHGVGGGHLKAFFAVDVTAITRTTGTLDVELWWSPDGTTAGGIKVAEVTGLIATGLAQIILEATFDGNTEAIPEPNIVVWDLIGDTTAVSGNVYATYGN